jgi:hypothetical protein
MADYNRMYCKIRDVRVCDGMPLQRISLVHSNLAPEGLTAIGNDYLIEGFEIKSNEHIAVKVALLAASRG